jgi:hypothetical protein
MIRLSLSVFLPYARAASLTSELSSGESVNKRKGGGCDSPSRYPCMLDK